LATFTGGVCPAAWSYHEASWRHSWDVVKQRIEHVDRMFRGQRPPGTSLEKELDLLGIEYLVIGEPERARYPDTDFAPLLDNFMLVTESVRTRLYERRYGGSHPRAAT